MDLWVVAAAVGVVYVAKYSKNFSGEKVGLSVSSPWDSTNRQPKYQNLLQKLRDQTCPLRRLVTTSEREDVSDGKFSEMHWVGGDSMAQEASTSGSDDTISANVGMYENYDILSTMNLSLGNSATESYQEIVDGIHANSVFFGNSGDVSPGFTTGRFMRIRPLRRKKPCGFFVKPLNSLESMETAQHYRERLEEYVFTSFPSSIVTMRPLLITDGNRIISRSSGFFGVQFDGGEDQLQREGEICLKENDVLLDTTFRQTGSVKPLGKRKQMGVKRQLRRSGVSFLSQGSPNGMLLFFIGITIGIMSAVFANKREMGKLNDQLKQSRCLVQDLHEELEMKDMLTVKELTNEDSQSLKTIVRSSFNGDPVATSSKQDLDEFAKYDGKEQYDQKAENSELISNIEAELQAELERLELNMKASSLDRISDFVELDSDTEPDVVQGDLKLDLVKNQTDGLSDLNRDASGTSNNHTDWTNYAVSPRELSLHLYEVIESRLEVRIKELETALENSQKRVHFLESESIAFREGLEYSKMGSSSTPGSPTFIDEGYDISRPFVINLSGEALDAYNEAYKEIIWMPETDEDTSNAG